MKVCFTCEAEPLYLVPWQKKKKNKNKEAIFSLKFRDPHINLI